MANHPTGIASKATKLTERVIEPVNATYRKLTAEADEMRLAAKQLTTGAGMTLRLSSSRLRTHGSVRSC